MNLQQSIKIQQVFLRCYSSQFQLQVVPAAPVIKVPAYIKKYVEIVKKRDIEKKLILRRRITYRGNTNIPVISCTDKQLNFYLGQRYNQNYPVPLLSKGWLKRKSTGQKFTIHPWDTNPALPVLYNKNHINEADDFPRTFSELLTNETVLEELKHMGYECPTPIQVMCMPAVLERKHLLLAAETGCGKTIGYLAPIIQNISSVKKNTKLFPNTPLALIVTPGRELAEQIGTVAYDLCRNSDVNVRVLISGGCKHEHLRLSENSDVDILVASIGTLSKMVLKKIMKLTNIRHLVLDEADTLVDDSFREGTEWLLRRIPLYISSTENLPPEQGTQLILVSSTYPIGAEDFLVEMFEKEDIVRIRSPYLHRVLCHVKQKFWKVDNGNRSGILLDLVKSDHTKKIPVMIFSSHSPACNWMSEFLQDNGVPNVKFHGGLSSAMREKALDQFRNGVCNVMCCTDLASRGLDTQHVKHVINFDFPTSVSDYILRVGRVGRVGTNHGYVTNLVVARAGAHTVQSIETAVRSTARLPDVDANIKKKIRKLFFTP